MVDAVRRLGAATSGTISDLGAMTRFLLQVVRDALTPPWRLPSIVDEVYKLGVLSLLIICVCGLAVGMVLGLQGYNTLERFGATQSLGAVVGLSLVRELGPVLTALFVVGRSGSAIATELGTMRVTEQIDAMESMAVNPIQYLVVPRIIASLLMFPVLTMVFNFIGYGGGYVMGVYVARIPVGPFVQHTREFMEPRDVLHGLFKAIVFGLLVSVITTWRGYSARGGAKGVGEGTTRAVVWSSIAVLVADYVITFIAVGT
jgi:phospholipid/cholesterol/gamma-HCH transport system permease protein